MISYEQVKSAVKPAPNEDLVSLYNELDQKVTKHTFCINEINPFGKIYKKDHFCISATSIQSNYIAFVLGKHSKSNFPSDMMQIFFGIDSLYSLQYGEIEGKQIDGCIIVIHKDNDKLDLQKVYDHIYEL